MKFYLIVAKGAKSGLPIPIDGVDLFVIGTDTMCQLRPKTPLIGPQHCAICTRERKVFIRDLNSGHSTIINGDVLPGGEEWPLHAGDRIAVGPLEFIIQFTEKALSQRDLEEWALKCLDDDSEHKRPAVEQFETLASTNQKFNNAANAAQAILDHLSAQRGIVQGRLRIAREGGVTIIRINDTHLVQQAELNLIKKELHAHLNHPNLRVLIDFKNVRRMSTAAAEMIGELIAWLKPWGSTMAICRMRTELQEALTTLPDTCHLRLYPDKPTAMAGKW